MLQKIKAHFMTSDYLEEVRKAKQKDISERGITITADKSTQDGGPTRTETYVNGRLVKVTTKAGNVIDYYYDEDGRMIRESGPKRTIEYYYGKSGQLARSINTTTGSVSDYIYKDHRLATIKAMDLLRKPSFTDIETDKFGRVTKKDNKWETITYEYDDAERSVTMSCVSKVDKTANTKKGDFTEVSVYDEYGRLVSQTRDKRVVKTYEYTGYIEASESFKIGKKPATTNYTTISVIADATEADK